MKEEARVTTKQLLDEIDSLKKIRENLKEEVSRLQIIQSNLEAQKHSADILKDQVDKREDAETFNKFAAEERRIEQKRIEAEGRIDTAENIERSLASRVNEVERRELKTSELETLIAKLNQERANFAIYKDRVEKELQEAQEIIAHAAVTYESINAEREALVGREKKVIEQERWWNDRIGELEIERRNFQIEKENFIGSKKEEVNV